MKIAGYIAAHNNADWIEAAVLSILDEPAVGLVVVAEGVDPRSIEFTAAGLSTDGTTEILQRLSAQHRGRMVHQRIGRVKWKGGLRNASLDVIDQRGPWDWILQWGDDEVLMQGWSRLFQRLCRQQPRVTAWNLPHICYWLDTMRTLDYRHRKQCGGGPWPSRVTRYRRGLRFTTDHNYLPGGWQFAKAPQIPIYHYGYVGPIWRLVERRRWHMRDRGLGGIDAEVLEIAILKDILCAGPHRAGQWLRPWPPAAPQPRRAMESPIWGKHLREFVTEDMLRKVARVPFRVSGIALAEGKWQLDNLDPAKLRVGGA